MQLKSHYSLDFYFLLSRTGDSFYSEMGSVPRKVQHLKRIILTALIVFLVAVPLASFVPVSAQPQRKAVIMSSLEKYVPMGYVDNIESFLTNLGYQVTFLADGQVTLDFLTTQLNNYNVIIWRTNVYIWPHTTYWYVGEQSNTATLQAYAADFAAGYVDNTNGILGVSQDFFQHHFNSSALSNVKLAFIIGTMSTTIAGSWVHVGAKAVIDCVDGVSLTFSNVDYIVGSMMRYLAHGYTVKDTLNNVIVPFLNMVLQDPLDTNYIPPMWFTGDGTVTIN